jgi:sugar lactone lactonase YvrE
MTVGRLVRIWLAAALAMLVLPAAAGAARSLYVVNGSPADNISIFNVAGGAPAAPPGVTTPFPEGATGPGPVAMSPDGAHLYTGDAGATGVVPHSVAANGALTAQPPVGSGSVPAGITVTADGGFLYATNSGDNSISGYTVAADGSLTALPGFPIPAGATPLGIASTPDAGNLYVTNSGDSTVSGYDIAADGTLTELPDSPFAVDPDPRGISITPDGRFLYTVSNSADTLWAFAIEPDGDLALVSGSPWITGTGGATGTAISPDGKNLFISGGTVSGMVDSTAISSDGTIGPHKLAFTGQEPNAVVAHPNGTNVYAVADVPNQLFSYSYGTSGILSPLGAPGALPNGDQVLQGAVVTPNQPPVAAFSLGTTPADVVATFNANATKDPDGSVVSYVWDFGDGKTATTAIPTVTHKYAVNGTYDVKLTVTDDEGCSTARVYTGQTALCNGSGVATVTKSIDTQPGKKPDNRVKNPTLDVKLNQRQKRHKIKVVAKVGAGENANIKLSGFIKKAGTKISLGKQSVGVRGTARKQVTLTVKREKGTKRALALLRKAGALRATIKAKCRDDARNKAQQTRNTTLRPKKRG